MYEQHFGLKKRPFHSIANGTDVFVGPQIATTMAGLKKALASNDAIVTISGPVGCGKTTMVTRVLEPLGADHRLILVARMRLGSGDVLALLLDELGVENQPGGTMQKFAAFRRRLGELESGNSRVFIIVEDSVRLGADTLAELEALTAADAGASTGASIVLMGDETLDVLLADTQLGRARQRIRQRYCLAPLSAAELRGYLRHCFRLAGGDFEQLFEANAASLLHHLCGGIPRTTNTLVEAALTAAADANVTQVSSELMARIAESNFGLSAAGFDLTVHPPIVNTTIAAPNPAPKPEPTPQAEPVPVEEPQVAAKTATDTKPATHEPVIVFADVGTAPVSSAAEIPELIQDTLPDLEVLTSELAASDSETLPTSDADALPDAKVTAVESASGDLPEWDRDPTLAELKPDLAALEQAMAFAHGGESASAAEKTDASLEKQAKQPVEIPEITLDHAISRRIDSKRTTSDTQEAPPPSPASDSSANKSNKADAEIEKIAAELATVKSIEDIDDKMAETLFGDELSIAAAQIIADPPSTASANEDHDAVIATAQTANNESNTIPAEEVTLEAPPRLDDGGIDLSASQRLKTVRALNADLHPSLRTPEASDTGEKPPTADEVPASIEDQMDTSMTQALDSLNTTPPTDTENGFLSRFKRS